MPRAYFINPENASIEEVVLSNGLQAIKTLIGQESIDSDEVGREGDRLFLMRRVLFGQSRMLNVLN